MIKQKQETRPKIIGKILCFSSVIETKQKVNKT